jgi:ribA/ribD-fused uncharacterized protein
MEKSNYFYKDRCLFGAYPTQKEIEDLENYNVRLFVNLTTEEENLYEYKSKYDIIKFPINDRDIPIDNYNFILLILFLENFVKEIKNSKIYIHCKGGHGRSAMVSACLLCRLESIDPDKAIEIISESHSRRKNLKDKWKNKIFPNSRNQRYYLKKIFSPLYFSKCFKNSEKNGLSNFSDHKVDIPGIGIFPNSESAYYALRNPYDKEYIDKLKTSKNPRIAKYIGEHYLEIHGNIEDEKKIENMYKILKLKFNQNEDIKRKLLSTAFRSIVNHNRFDSFWGDGGNNEGKNHLGILLTNLRNEFYKSGY